jgi:apolipoprotein N-acyltransferase
VGVAGLIALLAAAADWRRAAILGWLWGLGHFTLGNNWIATAFTYQAKMPAGLGHAAVVLLAGYLAIYPAIGAMGAWLIGRRLPVTRTAQILIFAACWIISEWLRSWVFTGFAWNPLGVAALGPFHRPGLAAVAPWLGTYALSGLVAGLAGCWWAAFARGKFDWRGVALVAGPILAFIQPGHYGARDGFSQLAYTLVQPGIPQEQIDDPAHYEEQFAKTAMLSFPNQTGQRRVVLWPESGVPDYLRQGYALAFYQQTTFAADPIVARKRMGRVIGDNAMLMTGAVDLEMDRGHLLGVRNVVTALDAQGNIVGGYAKAHLVPYGEYLPMRGLLEPLGIARLVPGDLDFHAGPGARTMDLAAWGKVGIQICYEIVFSGQVVDSAHRPDYIFNPTNDGWFGAFGPPQHLAQARLRAIEEGLPVLRATTSGISAVVDADGMVRGYIPRGDAAKPEAGRLDGFIPTAHPPTLFARLGNSLALIWAALCLLLSMVASRRNWG